jgi:rod shape-determining protein MreD
VRGLVALTVFGGGIAHATVAPALRIGNVSPDIPLVVVVLLALRRGPEFGCVAGFVAGLVQDAAGGGFIGVQGMTKALAGFAAGTASARLRPTQPLVQVPALVVLTLAEGILRYGLLALVRFPAGFVDVMVYVVVPQALYNGVLGAILVTAMTLLDQRAGRA